MAHNRKLVVGGAALTAARNNRYCIEVAGEIMDELEQEMNLAGYFDDAPFKWVGLMLRFGLKNEDEPHYQRINTKHGDLPVAIELDTRELRYSTREELKERFMIAALKTLVHVAQKYDLPGKRISDMLKQRQANGM